MNLTGRTRLVGVMGWPVSHSRSPAMHNAALQAAGLDVVYVPLPVDPANIGEAVRGLRALGFRGSNVTIPHKQTVIEYLDRLTDEAKVIGAVNTIRVEADGSMTGHNTDCYGAVGALRQDGGEVAGRTVVILGAGGAGRAVAAGCAFAGARRVVLLNRTVERAREVVAELRAKLPDRCEWLAGGLGKDALPESIWAEVSAVFQTTSVGMNDFGEIPLDANVLPSGCHVLESVYSPLNTPFLLQCRARGLRITDGLAMLLEQGALSFEFWFGIAPDRRAMRRALDS